MKRVLLTTVCIAAFCSASLAGDVIAEGKTYSALGDYRIESLDQPVILNGKELDAFTISYQNTNMKVTVAVEKTKNAKHIMYCPITCRSSMSATANTLVFRGWAKNLQMKVTAHPMMH